MSIISVDKETFKRELSMWGVPMNYVAHFMNGNVDKAGRVELNQFFVNEAQHLTNTRHWLAINAALWISAYREAESKDGKIEALAGIRSLFFAAAALGQYEVYLSIRHWWQATYELHKLPAPNASAVIKKPAIH
ncbi:hypothetical protein [Phytobacter diazotrophicus]|uniref:hypothetical protein n=1 Tax=Phytobacter diazotrophicus TaxID=395631 RepID=UPI0030763621